MLGSAPLFRGTVTTTSQNTHVSPPSLLPRALGRAVSPQGHCLVLVSHPSTPILTRDRGHQRAQPLVLLLQGFADFPHILQALGAKGKKPKRPIQCCISGSLPIPTAPPPVPTGPVPLQCRPLHAGGQAVCVGLLYLETQSGECLLAFSNQQGPNSSILSSCEKLQFYRQGN